LNAPGTGALPLAPLATLADWNVPSEVEQLLAEHTSKVALPVSLGSGSLKVALRVGVVELMNTASAGEPSAGVVGARSAVLFVIEALPSVAVAAALPVAVAASRTIGSLPGFVYVRSSVSRWWTALDSVNRVLSAAG
jgi:hypothetical protein